MPLPNLNQKELRDLRSFVAAMEEDAAAVERATIPVERTRGPVLLISGTDDGIWPSSDFSDRVMTRLAVHKHPFADAHLRYEGAGHWIDPPHVPTGASVQGPHPSGAYLMRYGGTAKANATANQDHWPKVLDFLGRSG